MLRMPRFSVVRPTSLKEAVAALGAPDAMPVAGGTDVLPGLKLRLFTPATLVALDGLAELKGITVGAQELSLGASTRLVELANHAEVKRLAPGLAMAAGLVASPQIRNMGTLGGNVLLDTRCRYYNQTHFWRQALGYCIKKDGTLCHVVPSGKRCVAALSTDTVPVLVSLKASLDFVSAKGPRTIGIEELFRGDGAVPHTIARDDVLVRVRVPLPVGAHRGAYLKVRARGSIDFPLLGVAVRLSMEGPAVTGADIVVTALQSRPVRLADTSPLVGTRPGDARFDEALSAVAARAYKQCRPMPNIPGDDDWRHEMVPVTVKRAVRMAAGLSP